MAVERTFQQTYLTNCIQFKEFVVVMIFLIKRAIIYIYI